MNTFLDVDKVECVTVEDAKTAYPQVDWDSDAVKRLMWDAPVKGRITLIMAAEDLKTLVE
jgi:hypothetical protein